MDDCTTAPMNCDPDHFCIPCADARERTAEKLKQDGGDHQPCDQQATS